MKAFVLARALRLHEGANGEDVAFARKNLARLSSRPSAFVSVSLAEATAEDATAPGADREKARQDVEAMIDRFLVETGWIPTATQPVAGATYPRYGFIVRLMMKHIASGVRPSTTTVRERVHTDWAALDRFIGQFVEGKLRDEAVPLPGRAIKTAPL